MNGLLQAEPLEGAGSQTGVRAINRHHGLAEEAYEAIFAQLMALRIAPGSRITVDNLAREFSVSQTPIREALGRLEGEGLVIKTHLIGYSAAPQITRRRFDELYDLRLLLELPRRSALHERWMRTGFQSCKRWQASCLAGRWAMSGFATPLSRARTLSSTTASSSLPAMS